MKKIALVLETDLSLSTGAAINERESVITLLDNFSDHLTVLSPVPAFPDVYYDNRIVYVHNHKSYHPYHYLLFFFSILRKIRKLRYEGRGDAVAFRLGLLPILPIVISQKKIPVLLKTLSGYAIFERKDRRFLFKILSYFLWPLYKKSIRCSQVIDTPSFALAEWFENKIKISKKKILVIPNGVNIKQFKPIDNQRHIDNIGINKYKVKIGYVGAMDNIRHIDDAIKAISSLDSFSDLGLVLVGKGPFLKYLKNLSREKGIHDRVLFLGFKPYKMIPSIISSFDIAFDFTKVDLCINGYNVSGSYSQKIPQYLACGVPVIAYRCKDTEFIDEFKIGTTVSDFSASTLAEAFKNVLALKEEKQISSNYIRNIAADKFSYLSISTIRFSYWQMALKGIYKKIGN